MKPVNINCLLLYLQGPKLKDVLMTHSYFGVKAKIQPLKQHEAE